MLRDVNDLDRETFSFAGSGERAAPGAVDIQDGANGATATISDAHLLFNSDFVRAGHDLILRGHDGGSALVRDYFASDERPALMSRDGARLSGDLVDAMSGSLAPGQYAQAGAAAPAASDAVGRVVTSSGDASIIRNGVAVTLKPGDPVLRADVLQTVAGTMAVTFNDGSTLNLTANTRIVVSEFVYSPNGAGNSQLLNLVQGSLTFISGEVAHSGNMRIGTPVATMGIRGTVGGVTTANDGTVHFYVSQSATGAVIINEQGQIIANVVQDGPMIVVRPVAPLQVVAEEIQKTPAQLALELQALQQIVSIKAVGDQLLQQFFQQQNPNDPNPQSPNDQPHTQIQINLHYSGNNGIGGDLPGGDNPHPFDDATIHFLSPNPDTPFTPADVIDLTQTNLPPITFAPLVAATNEDQTLTFSGIKSISVHDADTTVLTVTLTATHGLLALSSVAGLSFAAGNGASAATLTFSGTAAAINAALHGMTFTPSADYNGAASLTITAQDDASHAITTSIPIAVAAVNDAPVLDYFNVNVAEGGTVTLSPGDFHVTDPDGPATIFTVTNVSGGYFMVGSGNNAQFSLFTAPTGPLTFTAEDIAAGRVKFVHDGGENAPSFTIRVSDGIASSNPVSETGTITQHVNDAPVVTAATATVSEEGLCHGIPDSSGTSDTTNSATAHGTIHATDAEGDSLTYKLGLPDAVLTSDNMPITWALGEDGTLTGSACGNAVISVTLDEHTGAYTVNLLGPIDHPDGGGENTLNFGIPVTVDDGSATTSSTLTVKIEDDGPHSVDFHAVANVAATQGFNVAFVLDYSGSIDDIELNTMLEAVKTAAHSIFDGTTGAVAVTAVAFENSATTLGTFTSYESFAAALDATNPSLMGHRPGLVGGTNFDAAVEQVIDHFVPVEGARNQIFFLSDGQSSVTSQAEAWANFVTSHGINVTAVGIGDGISDSGLQSVDVDGSGSPILVSQFSDIVDSLLTLVAQDNTGNVLTAGSGFGADGGHIESVSVDGAVYTWDGIESVTSSSQAQWTHTAASLTVTTALGGALTFYFAGEAGHAAGDWTYTPPGTASSNEVFHYTLVDNDGDRSTADITIDTGAPEFNATAVTAASLDIDHTLVTGLAIADGDAGSDPLTFSFTGQNGTFAFHDAVNGLSVSGSDTHTLTATGTLSAINEALGHGIVYTGDGPQPPTSSALATINDAHGGTDTLNFIFGVGYAPTDAVSLAGTSGKDIIFSAGTGATLTGGDGSDIFVFQADNGGTAKITDFNIADDYLQISHSIFASVDALLSSAQDDGHGNTVISSPNHGSVVLDGVTAFQSIDHSHIVIV